MRSLSVNRAGVFLAVVCLGWRPLAAGEAAGVADAAPAISDLLRANDDDLAVTKMQILSFDDSMGIETRTGNLSRLSANAKIRTLRIQCADEVAGLTVGGVWTEVKVLSVIGAGISNLDFLENFPNLYKLEISSYALRDLKGIGKCPSLRELSLDCKALTEPAFEGLSLTGLRMIRCGITNLDGLKGMKSLQSLEVRACPGLDDIDGIAGLVFQNLTLSLVPVTGVDELDFKNIKTLDLSFNEKLNSCASLRSLPDDLYSLNLIRTELRDFTVLMGKSVNLLDLPVDQANAANTATVLAAMKIKRLGLQVTDRHPEAVFSELQNRRIGNNLDFLAIFH